MKKITRYALYWAPAPGPLASFAARWLGWDPAAATAVAQPDLPGLPRPVAELTAEPRKYGFHGTLKAPFRLAEGTTPEALQAAVAALAATLAPVTLDGMRLATLGRFLALVPVGETAALARLAGTLVDRLDPFRAPLTAADLARRKADALPPRQRALLDRYGYPYVMEEFRFHLTLTGPVDPDTAGAVRAVLEPQVAPLLPRPFVIDAVCLFGEAEDGRFHVLHRYALTG